MPGTTSGPNIHHIALRVAALERSRAFYVDLLGLAERKRFEEEGALRSIWLQAGTTVVMLELAVRGQGSEAGSGHLLAFAVASLLHWEERLRRAGIPIDERTEHTLYLRDPDGHRVGLSKYAFAPLTGDAS